MRKILLPGSGFVEEEGGRGGFRVRVAMYIDVITIIKKQNVCATCARQRRLKKADILGCFHMFFITIKGHFWLPTLFISIITSLLTLSSHHSSWDDEEVDICFQAAGLRAWGVGRSAGMTSDSALCVAPRLLLTVEAFSICPSSISETQMHSATHI